MSKAIIHFSFQDQPDAFLEKLSQAADLTGCMSANEFQAEHEYQLAYDANNYDNISFCVEQSGTLAAIVFAYRGKDSFYYYTGGVKIILLNQSRKVINNIFETLIERAKHYKVPQIHIDDRESQAYLSLIGAAAYNHKGTAVTKLESVIDLDQSEEQIHKNLRQSYKPLVNQGMREIDFYIIDAKNPDKEKFDEFQAFHCDVAGKQTRDQATWDMQFQMIKDGHGELMMGYMAEHGLVSAAYFNYWGKDTIYSTAAYDRDLFEYPLAHASIYKAIMRAKERGQNTFYLGQIPEYENSTEKEFNIAKFKKGFCERLKIYIEWQIPVL